MRLIAVLDLLAGKVVRGIAGRRQAYRPIESRLAGDASPAAVAAALTGQFSIDALYVADLDAIAGAEPDWQAYEVIAAATRAETGRDVRIWVDAGVGDAARARQMADARVGGDPLAGVVVGLESLAGPDQLAQTLDILGADRAVFSLDLKDGRPLAARETWSDHSAESIATLAVAAGFRRMIVLDLAQVGTGGGISVGPLCRRLRSAHAAIELVSGGGVRGIADLRRLAEAGCGAALVASALHDGRLTKADVAAAAGW